MAASKSSIPTEKAPDRGLHLVVALGQLGWLTWYAENPGSSANNPIIIDMNWSWEQYVRESALMTNRPIDEENLTSLMETFDVTEPVGVPEAIGVMEAQQAAENNPGMHPQVDPGHLAWLMQHTQMRTCRMMQSVFQSLKLSLTLMMKPTTSLSSDHLAIIEDSRSLSAWNGLPSKISQLRLILANMLHSEHMVMAISSCVNLLV